MEFCIFGAWIGCIGCTLVFLVFYHCVYNYHSLYVLTTTYSIITLQPLQVIK